MSPGLHTCVSNIPACKKVGVIATPFRAWIDHIQSLRVSTHLMQLYIAS